MNIKVILKRLSALKFSLYVLLFTALSFFVLVLPWGIFGIFNINTNNDSTPSLKQSGIIKIILSGIVLAPILETLIFQKLFFDFLKTKIRVRFIILISALCFGLSHFYDLSYVINTFFIGIILAIAYAFWSSKKISPFWVVVTIHLLHNLIVLVVEITS